MFTPGIHFEVVWTKSTDPPLQKSTYFDFWQKSMRIENVAVEFTHLFSLEVANGGGGLI